MAYGVDAAFGLQPRQYLDGSLWTGQQSEYLINGNINNTGASYATSLYTGDLVTLLNDGTIGRTAAGENASIGVFWGCKYYDASNNLVFSPYWPASTSTFKSKNPIAYVVDDANVLFAIQAKGTVGISTPPATGSVNTINMFWNTTSVAAVVSDLNWNYNWAVGTPSTTSNISGGYLDLSTQATTATHQLKLIRLEPRPGNDFGVLFNVGLVLINNHVYKGGTGTVGV